MNSIFLSTLQIAMAVFACGGGVMTILLSKNAAARVVGGLVGTIGFFFTYFLSGMFADALRAMLTGLEDGTA